MRRHSPRSESVDLADPDKDQSRLPSLVSFLMASYYAILSRTDVVCYVVIVMNQIKSASLLSLPLPLMAFLWGSLSVPRPTKTFWITVITYTEAVVVVKYLFQFDLFEWYEVPHLSRPYDPPTLLGIKKRRGGSDYALYDLLLLLLVFLHRYMLKSLGLWKDTDLSSSPLHQQDAMTEETFLTAERVPSDVSLLNAHGQGQALEVRQERSYYGRSGVIPKEP